MNCGASHKVLSNPINCKNNLRKVKTCIKLTFSAVKKKWLHNCPSKFFKFCTLQETVTKLAY